MLAIPRSIIRTLTRKSTDVRFCFTHFKQFSTTASRASGVSASRGSHQPITKVDIDLPEHTKGKLAFVLYNVLSKQECEDYVDISEAMGYKTALVNIGAGKEKLLPDIRKSDRCIWDTVEESNKCFQRIKSYLPDTWQNRDLVGLNERLRVLRYDRGGFFSAHRDGQYKRENGETSFITVQLYLNEGYRGGSTTFLGAKPEEKVPYEAKTGSVLVFQHDILHQGSQLLEGRKYVIRTEVMYGPEKK